MQFLASDSHLSDSHHFLAISHLSLCSFPLAVQMPPASPSCCLSLLSLLPVMVGIGLSMLELVPHARGLKLKVSEGAEGAQHAINLSGAATFVSLPKLSMLRELREKHGHRYLIEVDGGVKPANAWKVIEAGANAIVSGSGVFGAADYAEAIQGIRTSRRPQPALV